MEGMGNDGVFLFLQVFARLACCWGLWKVFGLAGGSGCRVFSCWVCSCFFFFFRRVVVLEDCRLGAWEVKNNTMERCG